MNKVWELTAVSLAAQVLTFPVCLYYFHQFPVIFLFTNLLTVPLSTIILFVEIFLVAFAWIPFVGFLIGKVTWWLVWLMNKIILFFNGLPYALWERIPASVASTVLLYIFVCGTGFWLLNKSKIALRLCLFSLLAFTFLNAYTKWDIVHQKKMIVYNIAQHRAIDFVNGNSYKFIGDSALMVAGMLQNYNLKPGRIELQLNSNNEGSEKFEKRNYFLNFLDKTFLMLDSSVIYKPQRQRINIDVIVISKNPKISISQLDKVFNCGQYIFDASNSLWKIEQWKEDCDRLHLPFFSVPEKGAFIMDL